MLYRGGFFKILLGLVLISIIFNKIFNILVINVV